ncbi:MAG: sulfotransferase family 2 domain-containing protein [Bacteroidota bacterium]
MTKENIFIHILKTGGTTINCAMNKSEWQTEVNFYYRHIIYETKRSNSKDIFNPFNYEKYRNYNIFMMLRHPVDRMISEYHFFKDRQDFLSLLKPIPKNFEEYIKNKQTQNYMIGFLLGKRVFDTEYVVNDDLELVINTIERLPIHVGIFEHFMESMLYFGKKSGIKWPKKINIKRVTLNRPDIKEVSEEIKNLILKNNELDYKLYNYCLELFNQKVKNINKKTNTVFKGDVYDYALKYSENRCLLEINLKNKNFISSNLNFFQDLNIYLHTKLKIKNGKQYVELWNDALINSIKETFPDSTLSKEIESITDKHTDPLTLTKKIANTIDNILFYKQKKLKHLYNKKLSFQERLINKKVKIKFNLIKLMFKNSMT